MPQDRSYIKMLADAHYVEPEPEDENGYLLESRALLEAVRQISVRMKLVESWRQANWTADGPAARADYRADAYIRSLLERHGIAADGQPDIRLAALAVRSEAAQLGVRARAVRDWTAAVLVEIRQQPDLPTS